MSSALPEAAARLWAKRCEGGGRIHPLACHLLDVASVAQALWDHGLAEGLRAHFARAFGGDEDCARAWLACLAGLHDLGKASPGFQGRDPAIRLALEEAQFHFPNLGPVPHGHVTAAVLPALLERCGCSTSVANTIASAVGGHHGTFVNAYHSGGIILASGRGPWDDARHALFDWLWHELGAPVWPHETEHALDAATLVLLAGLTSVADWIASAEPLFPYAGRSVDLGPYQDFSRQTAADALQRLQFSRYEPPDTPRRFADLFPGIEEPNALQTQTIAWVERPQEPTLLIVEVPMGGGKTEAALYVAAQQITGLGEQGLYVALPTQATANAMHGRVRDFAEQLGSAGSAKPLLVHGLAMLYSGYAELEHAQVSDADPQAEGGVSAASWFAQRKRPLLAPVGVGTIDQALMSVLQTRHWFVRLFGLAHKTVIFDEVHAYDTYMSELLDHLLRWLAAVGCSVIVLSATLPSRRRRKLLEAYAGRALDDVPQANYPRMTWVCGRQPGATGLPMGEGRTTRIFHLPDDPAGLAHQLREALAEGGCAAVVCNTVGRAQAMYRTLQETGWAKEETDLFHARFPFGEREVRENRTLRRFGKGGERPARCVLVATQVIEQSLDLDFDLLVTDLAPVDLVLQRAGRLHRHDRPERPVHLGEPQLWVIEPRDADGAPPHFGDSEYIYERYLLLRTYLLLRDRRMLTLPAEIEELVETVYTRDAPGGLPEEWVKALEEAQEAAAKQREGDAWKAHQVRVRFAADADEIVEQYNVELSEDEDPRTHETLRAATRLTRPTVALVCLHEQPDGTLAFDSAGEKCISLDPPPDMQQTEQLLRSAVSSSHWRVVKHFADEEPPGAWRRNPLLRFHRLAVFSAGVCERPGFRLVLDPDLGLIVDTGEKAGGE